MYRLRTDIVRNVINCIFKRLIADHIFHKMISLIGMTTLVTIP